ncbi:MAG: TIGR03086 family protein [Actinobacteria bacterium]|nr:TIGR03086 family protein [Actinomycetota bacterium]
MNPVQFIEQAVSNGQTILDGIQPGQLGDSTPCAEFDVKALTNHLTGAAKLIAIGVNEHRVAAELMSEDFVGDDPATGFRQAGKELVEAWNQPGVLERNVMMPFGEVPGEQGATFSALEIFTHVADTAIATGQEGSIDVDLANTILGIAQQMPIDNFRMPGVFGPEVECAEDAPAHRRLLALLGREV